MNYNYEIPLFLAQATQISNEKWIGDEIDSYEILLVKRLGHENKTDATYRIGRYLRISILFHRLEVEVHHQTVSLVP